MAFNSLQYLQFFVAVFVAAWLLSGFPRFRIWFLLGASFFFYSANNGWLTLLIILTATLDYLVCLALARTKGERARRGLVAVSVVSNLGVLAWFKYANFLEDIGTRVAGLLGLHPGWVALHILLPVGISFYTFEAISYTVDVYRGVIPAERNWNRLAFLVTFFPHLIAGPIVRAGSFFPQVGRRPRLTRAEFEGACLRIGRGLVQKIVFADGLAPLADAAFDRPAALGTAHVWLGVYAFAFQIFFDFSGYTDIALGSAQLLGFQLPENFRQPYAATSISDFWRRWHMTLSTWLRDYLYIPLGGNRMKSKWGVYRNLMLTMLLGGLWHGAAWTFVLWGGIHGLGLSVERALGIGRRPPPLPAPLWIRAAQALIVFHLVVLAWIAFRARNLSQMGTVLGTMFSARPGTEMIGGGFAAATLMGLAWIWQVVLPDLRPESFAARHPVPIRALAYSFGAAALLVTAAVHYWGAPQAPKSFIYFRF